jgi:hypothetical protein
MQPPSFTRWQEISLISEMQFSGRRDWETHHSCGQHRSSSLAATIDSSDCLCCHSSHPTPKLRLHSVFFQRQFRIIRIIITLNLCYREFGGFCRIWKGPSLNGKKHLAFVQAACFSSSWFPTEQRAKLVSAACLLFLIFGQPWEPANARESKDTSQRVIFAADTIHTGWTLDALIDHTILIGLINFRKFPC